MIFKKFLFILFFLLSLTLSAQSDSYEPLSEELKNKSIKISEEKVGPGVTYNSGMNYDGMLYWHVIASDKKEYYFSSDTAYTNVTHEEGEYSSLMEYVIDTVGF